MPNGVDQGAVQSGFAARGAEHRLSGGNRLLGE
jgi:hypothetical protein